MPSFRVTVTIGALRPGVPGDRVLPTAANAIAELTTVEASRVTVARGEAGIVVRFTADDAELAEQIARHAVEVTATVAEPLRWTVTQRVRGDWVRIAAAP